MKYLVSYYQMKNGYEEEEIEFEVKAESKEDVFQQIEDEILAPEVLDETVEIVCIDNNERYDYYDFNDWYDSENFKPPVPNDNDIYLKKIELKNFLGSGQQVLDFENGELISILIAPNGYGKTTVLNFIQFLFDINEENYKKIEDIPFGSVKYVFMNGRSIELIKENIQIKMFENKFMHSYEIKLKINDKIYEITKEMENEKKSPTHIILSNVGKKEQSEENEKKEYLIFKKIKKAMEDEKVNYNIENIGINRIYKQNFDKGYNNVNTQSFFGNTLSINSINKEIKQELDKIIGEYNIKLNDAKNKLLTRYINEKNDNKNISKEIFKKNWEVYLTDILKFTDIGFIKNDYYNVIKNIDINSEYESKSKFLNIYYEEFNNALDPFKKVWDEMKLFIDVLNNKNKMTSKTFKFDKELGILIKKGNSQIAVDKLSSGEQHNLIMFYDLIFKMKNRTLVLIDEPELSLHINWQEEFLNDLQKIIKMKHIQIIIATHSPSIVNGHFEYYPKQGFSVNEK